MYRPSTGGMSSDDLRKAIISSNSSLFLNKGKVTPIDLHKVETSVQDLAVSAFDCCLGHLLFFEKVNPLSAAGPISHGSPVT